MADKMVVASPNVGLFTVDMFCGNDEEDVAEFLDVVLVFFLPNEVHYPENPDKVRARLMYMASLQDGKRNTWDKATALMKTRFANRTGGQNTDWV